MLHSLPWESSSISFLLRKIPVPASHSSPCQGLSNGRLNCCFADEIGLQAAGIHSVLQNSAVTQPASLQMLRPESCRAPSSACITIPPASRRADRAARKSTRQSDDRAQTRLPSGALSLCLGSSAFSTGLCPAFHHTLSMSSPLPRLDVCSTSFCS